MFRSYLRLLLFTFGLLVGIQVPGWSRTIAKRVEAHLFESREALDGFRQTAQRFFKGDLQALVRHYRGSDDPVFNSDANSIESLMIRNQLLDKEWPRRCKGRGPPAPGMCWCRPTRDTARKPGMATATRSW